MNIASTILSLCSGYALCLDHFQDFKNLESEVLYEIFHQLTYSSDFPYQEIVEDHSVDTSYYFLYKHAFCFQSEFKDLSDREGELCVPLGILCCPLDGHVSSMEW